MTIFDQLEKEHSKENSLKIIQYIGNDPERFDELMNCFFMRTKDYRVPQRAAHVVSLCFDRNPELIQPYLNELISKLMEEDLKGPLKRNILRILQFCAIPEDQMGAVYERTFELLSDPQEEIAIRAFAITILYNISNHHHDLKQELMHTIEFVLEEPMSSPGIQTRGKKILAKLYKELGK